ncbi:hypothetical protein A0O34_15790 [Chryseobacterium glaciei]|uniref:C1q domain-containing protein n=2 Tax=Chryseobacterium glaciei TaxID=1685010 RepID=A0A172XYD9_9FLAO|nr:hypothetical protein A0O34_15790 [Chryseobacterium glaciei]
MAIMGSAQVIIGSANSSPAAILKLDANNKALRIPNLSVTNRTNAVTPILSPANGVMIYNTNTDINNDIAKGITYWGSDSKYHSQASYSATEAVISSSQIPLLIFSAAIGQKPNVPVGFTAGGGYTVLNLSTPEILFDKYLGWNMTNNQFKIPSTGIYMLEFVTDMSNTGNNGGTPVLRITKGGTTLISISGRFNNVSNRMYTTLITTQNLSVNDLLDFRYVYTDNNYSIQTGTLNIYKYQ